MVHRRLPLRLSGLGLTPAKWINRVVYISSIVASYPLTKALVTAYEVHSLILRPLAEIHATLLPPESSDYRIPSLL